MRFLTIAVNDQLGDPIGDIYDMAEVEELDGIGHIFSINQRLTAAGTYSDPVGDWADGTTVAVNDPSVGTWPNQPLLPLPSSKVRTITQNISVDIYQFPLSPGVVNRKVTMALPSSVTISW